MAAFIIPQFHKNDVALNAETFCLTEGAPNVAGHFSCHHREACLRTAAFGRQTIWSGNGLDPGASRDHNLEALQIIDPETLLTAS